MGFVYSHAGHHQRPQLHRFNGINYGGSNQYEQRRCGVNGMTKNITVDPGLASRKSNPNTLYLQVFSFGSLWEMRRRLSLERLVIDARTHG